MPESTMVARTGLYALALSAALVMASDAVANKAMAQADEAAVEAGEAAAQASDTTALDEAVQETAPGQQSVAADSPAKSDLDQSAARAAPVVQSPRATRASIRAIAVPKILGSYR
jgi:hypothetical protein